MKRSKMVAFALAAALSVSMAVPAFAAGYEFSGLQPGGNFYQVTEHGQANEANSGTIIVGARRNYRYGSDRQAPHDSSERDRDSCG